MNFELLGVLLAWGVFGWNTFKFGLTELVFRLEPTRSIFYEKDNAKLLPWIAVSGIILGVYYYG